MPAALGGTRATITVLLLGLAVRLPMVTAPLAEGHRNAQTATLTAGMIEEGVLRLDPVAPWRGDLGARLAQELPVYNLAVLAIDCLPGVSFDAAGRLASLLFWVLSFVALQALWRRTLPAQARIWANLLFVLAPMNWYLSTAFMPETLLQLLSVCFLVCAIDYARDGSLRSLFIMTGAATVGLLVKFPAFFHLGIFACCVVADRQGWRALFRPRLIMSFFSALAAVALWGRCISGVNAAFFPYWTGTENILGFVQPQTSRLGFSFLAPLAGYNLAFVLPVVMAPLAAIGAISVLRSGRLQFADRVWIYLSGCLAIYWLLWAKGAAAQSYYNLPNLVLFAALFGIGMSRALDWMRARQAPRMIVRLAGCCAASILLVWGFAGFRYLSRPDNILVEAAAWLRDHAGPDDLVVFQPRHSAAVMDYEHQPLLSHLTGHRTWIWTRSTPAWEKERALQTSKYALITSPSESYGLLEKFRQYFKGAPLLPPASVAEQHPESLKLVYSTESFRIYEIFPGSA